MMVWKGREPTGSSRGRPLCSIRWSSMQDQTNLTSLRRQTNTFLNSRTMQWEVAVVCLRSLESKIKHSERAIAFPNRRRWRIVVRVLSGATTVRSASKLLRWEKQQATWARVVRRATNETVHWTDLKWITSSKSLKCLTNLNLHHRCDHNFQHLLINSPKVSITNLTLQAT